jgi:hypothetical protein
MPFPDRPERGPGANSRQVAGEHYGLKARQHWDVVAEFNLDYYQGQCSKYLFRWKLKGGLQDLEKAKHYLEKYMELAAAGQLSDWRPVRATDDDGSAPCPGYVDQDR